MRLLHYVEIENFKRYGGTQRIELDHPAVLIGPNNCGKTSALQAIALWSIGLRTWQMESENSKADAIENEKAFQAAVALDVSLLYPMSGISADEAVILPQRIEFLMGGAARRKSCGISACKSWRRRLETGRRSRS